MSATRFPSALRALALLLLVLALAAPSRAADTPSFQIVRPSDEAHNLLPKTCRVCHKKEDLAFFVVAAQSEEALDKALQLLQGSGEPAAEQPGKSSNPHADVPCLFCHLRLPGAGEAAADLSFRTLDGVPAALAEVERLCRVCHLEDRSAHPKVLGRRDPLPDLRHAGLPVHEGKVLCSTCHEMHAGDTGPASVRGDYQRFAARSAASFPHGNRAACRACHPRELAEGSEPVFLGEDPAQRCASCHPEDHGRIHPVAAPSSEKTYPMDFLGYPLDAEGRLACNTCHDEVCYGEVDPKNRRFLRGAPYVTPTEFCYRCHPKAGTGALNPHDQVDAKGKVVSTVCVFCHRVIPQDPEGSDFRPEDLAFLHSPVELCLGCHEAKPHPSVNHLVEAPRATVERLVQYEERHGVRLPLDPEGRIVCTTCHNPHEKGVLRGTAALGAGELNQWRVPSFAELCTPCHARYD